ncbi:MAG: hypothetical protein IPO92_06575, partial [Saprospiraceae bacterium]|nr:hypothetical protein [Saprospiraceae bacterium]
VLNVNISTIVCGTACCILDMVPFSFDDDLAPVFINPPGPITYACFDEVPPIPILDYIDNCIPAGMVAGTQVAAYTNCAGGTITRTWTKTDLCANVATHVQVITISPIPVALINNPPPNVTLPCASIPPARRSASINIYK